MAIVEDPSPYSTQLLQHVRVLSFCHYLQGPAAAQYLADMGADVIKLEVPGTGDDSRQFPPFKGGESLYYVNLNRYTYLSSFLCLFSTFFFLSRSFLVPVYLNLLFTNSSKRKEDYHS